MYNFILYYIPVLWLINFSISGILMFLCNCNLERIGERTYDVKSEILNNFYIYSLFPFFPLTFLVFVIYFIEKLF